MSFKIYFILNDTLIKSLIMFHYDKYIRLLNVCKYKLIKSDNGNFNNELSIFLNTFNVVIKSIHCQFPHVHIKKKLFKKPRTNKRYQWLYNRPSDRAILLTID